MNQMVRITESGTEAFMHWLHSPDYYAVAYDCGNGMWAGVKPLMFHWTLHTGMIGDRHGYEDRWCYADEQRARDALERWKAANFEGEPTGWRRHPASGRRRNDDGDPASEWIAS